jgi:hypothetical protein
MSALSVLLYVALIVYVLSRKVQGQAITETRKLFVLPVIVTVIGYGDLTRAGLGGADVAVTVIGSVVALALGVQRGRADKVSVREGATFIQWGAASLILFGANIVAKVLIDLIGLAAGATLAGAEQSLVFTLGLTLVGEALILWLRAESSEASGMTDLGHVDQQDRAAPR